MPLYRVCSGGLVSVLLRVTGSDGGVSQHPFSMDPDALRRWGVAKEELEAATLNADLDGKVSSIFFALGNYMVFL